MSSPSSTFLEKWYTKAEYLNYLQRFNKWKHERRNLSWLMTRTIGPACLVLDIVVVKDDRLLPCKWPLARVIKVQPGP
jgi:hypothetical protein